MAPSAAAYRQEALFRLGQSAGHEELRLGDELIFVSSSQD